MHPNERVCVWLARRWWFRKGLWLFPHALWLGKLEDDALVHASRLLFELRWAYAAAGGGADHSERAQQGRLGPLAWYSKFLWAAARDTGAGAFEDRFRGRTR